MRLLILSILIFGFTQFSYSEDDIPEKVNVVIKRLAKIESGDEIFEALSCLKAGITMHNQNEKRVMLDSENPADRWHLFDSGHGDKWLIEVITVYQIESKKYPVTEIGICRGSAKAWKEDRGWKFGLTKVFPRRVNGKIYATKDDYEKAFPSSNYKPVNN